MKTHGIEDIKDLKLHSEKSGDYFSRVISIWTWKFPAVNRTEKVYIVTSLP